MTRLVLALLMYLFSNPLWSDPEQWREYTPVQLTEATDLSVEGSRARIEKSPILLLISQDHCPYCVQIKQEILGPMIISGEYEGRLLIREIFIDFGSRVHDFEGKEMEGSTFAHRYGVYLTPTLLFLGPDGNELAERLVGIQTPEMFFFYVDTAVEEAIAALRQGD